MNILFAREVMDEWMYYVQNSPGEVSVFGRVEFTKGCAKIVSIVLPKQYNTGTTTEFNSDAMSTILIDAVNRGIPPESYVAWIHSHANMGVFWSGTDEENIQRFGISGKHLVSVVSNKKGEHLGRIDVFEPYGINAVCHVGTEASIAPQWKENLANAVERRPDFHVEPFRKRQEYGGLEDCWWKDERSGLWQGELFPEEKRKAEEKQIERKDGQDVLTDILIDFEQRVCALFESGQDVRDSAGERALHSLSVAEQEYAVKEVKKKYAEILEFCGIAEN